MSQQADSQSQMENDQASSEPRRSTRQHHGAAAAPAASSTMTITAAPPASNDQPLSLTLGPRASVRWDENVVDNEGLGRKSSKRCCIFHKQRPFGESSTDSSDCDSDGDGQGKKKKIARPKKNDNVPDFQRFHA